jgi:hypothetical protein
MGKAPFFQSKSSAATIALFRLSSNIHLLPIRKFITARFVAFAKTPFRFRAKVIVSIRIGVSLSAPGLEDPQDK